ncbi:MAG TPA: hypothetical protein VMH04_04175 [Candidatus Solibacter sp.]|nr:hypothetical protein [Candidatus Solibacter sp.]
MCLTKDGGTWIKTTLPQSSESRVQHTAKLKVTDSGTLEGKVTVTYTGLQAMYHRLEVLHSDDVARKKFLEDLVKGEVAESAETKLTNKPDWTNSETPLTAEFDLSVPDWTSRAGKRTVMPASLFAAVEKHVFERTERVHPIYFAFPYEKDDDVTIGLPPGWQLASVPPPAVRNGSNAAYSLKVENNQATLRLNRKLSVDVFLMDKQYYPALRDFFQAVRAGDDQQIVLQPPAVAVRNSGWW